MVHLYCMEDEDLASEAECASFLLVTNSADSQLCCRVLDAWMAKLLEDYAEEDYNKTELGAALRTALKNLPYKFPYPLTEPDLLKIHNDANNFWDSKSLKVYLDRLNVETADLQKEIKRSINQQFCRVRFGGEYNSQGTKTMWFRISSVGYNWLNTIYTFLAENYRAYGVETVTICRDFESDNGGDGNSEYFYTAKDGTTYYEMPIAEFFDERHDTSPVFSSVSINAGIYHYIKSQLSRGETFDKIEADLKANEINMDLNRYRNRLIAKECKDCIHASEFFDNAPTRTRTKLGQVMQKILGTFPEITEIDVNSDTRENTKGNPVGVNYYFTLKSKIKELNNLEVKLGYNKQFIPADVIFRDFRRDYTDYKIAKNL